MTCVVPRVVSLVSPRDDGGELLLGREDCRNIVIIGYASSFAIRVADIRYFLVGANSDWNITINNQTRISITIENSDGSLNWRLGVGDTLTLGLNDFQADRYSFEDVLFYLLGLKQDVLVSGVNIKTINDESILGSGDLEVR